MHHTYINIHKDVLREVPNGVVQERNPSIQHLTVGKYDVPGGSETIFLSVARRSGVWGGVLAGTVRSLPVVNRK